MNPHATKNTLCLAIDRLHVGYLGPYGNSWIETPSVDRLAAESFVLDQCLIDSPWLPRMYRSWWQGRHAIVAAEPAGPPLPELLARHGVHTALLSDTLDVLRHPLAAGFAEQIELESERRDEVAESIEQTQLARSFAQLIDWLDDPPPQPLLAWCHLGSLGWTWDAPYEFRQRYGDEEDPDPGSSSVPPCCWLAEDFDPDEVLAASHAYAGQVTLLDTCLGALLEALDESPLARDTLVVLTAPRGMALGEQRRLGAVDEALYAPLVHVPLMLRFPDGQGRAARSQTLVEPADLGATLREWHAVAGSEPADGQSLLPLIRGDERPARDRLICIGQQERAVRTVHWYLREGERDELYVKPDDRWEANDVATRCREVVEQLGETLERSAESRSKGETMPPLPERVQCGAE